MRTGILIALLLSAPSWSVRAQEFYFGNDLSYVNQMEDCGAVFREGGVAKDPYEIFARRGSNLVRVRLWVDPYWWQAPLSQPDGVKSMYSDLSDVRETIQRAKAAGMQVLLDFHYSDFWADPGRQLIPRAWAASANNLEAMKSLVYSYTATTLTALEAEGLMPEMVQVGNEITSGLLKHIPAASGWEPAGTVSNNTWARHAQILNEAIRAVRDVGASASINPKIAIHLAGGLSGYLWRFWNDVMGNGVTDFDVMGISAYFAWDHYGDLFELEYEIEDMASTFPSYEVMVLETAYPWTSQNFDALGNIVTSPDPDYLPLSPGKQLEYLTDYTRAVMRAGGTGVVFWEPAWVSTPCRTPWGQGSSHDHLVFFDPVQTNFMEEGGGRWMERQFYEDLSAPKVVFELSMLGQDVSKGVYITGDLGHDAGSIVPMWPLGGSLYYYYGYLPAGSSGTLHFLNGPDPGDREILPASCAPNGERPYSVPASGGTFSYTWGACATDVDGVVSELPDRVALHPAYPNPFNPATTLSFDLPRASAVTLEVYDAMGRLVRTLVDSVMDAGRHEIRFEVAGLPSGTYLCRLSAGSEVDHELLTLIR